MPPLTPQAPAQMSHMVIKIALLAGVLFIIGGVWYFLAPQPTGSVPMLVIRDDGTRVAGVYSLKSGFIERTDIDAEKAKVPDTYTLSDGSSISLSFSGIVRTYKNGADALLVVTAVAPSDRTPLAVSTDGQLLAWVNPSDNSLQVFRRNARGTYLPIYTSANRKISTLGFTDDGTALLAAKVVTARGGASATTELSVVSLSDQRETKLSSISGYATIIAP